MGVIVNSRSGKKSLLVKVLSLSLSVSVCINGGLAYGTCKFDDGEVLSVLVIVGTHDH